MKNLKTDTVIVSALAFVAFVALSPGSAFAQNVGATTMQEFYAHLTGEWTGSYALWVGHGAPSRNSDTVADGRYVSKGGYFLLSYSWEDGGEKQEGIFFMGGDHNMASATWGDSWHIQPEPMICKGVWSEDGQKLVFLGSYGAGPGVADWGWRTEFTLQGEDSFLM